MSTAAPPVELDSALPPAGTARTPARVFAWLREAVPHGGTLPSDHWQRRHAGIVVLLWLHAGGITAYALVQGLAPLHAAFEGSAIAALAYCSRRLAPTSRVWSAVLASAGLLTSSALLVHVSGGYVEFHFHFFVMIGIIALYEDWLPFAVAVGYVALHHGVLGTVTPENVYNHPDALAHPWKWAAIHAGFVLAASVVSIIAWRQNERSRTEAQDSYRRLYEAEHETRVARSQLLDRTMRVAEAERTRLAAELHDGPIQRLTAFVFRLSEAEMTAQAAAPEAAAAVASVEEDLSAEVGRLRRLMAELRPPALDERGLSAALRDLVGDFSQRTRVHAEVETALCPRMEHEIETTLYRVVQEALANVARHADAQHVTVSASEADGTLELVVADDGRGFDAAAASMMAERDHFGLVAMRERVELAGGTWHVTTAPGEGTRLTATFSRPVAAQ